MIPKNTLPRKSKLIVEAGVVDLRLSDTRLPRLQNTLEEVTEITRVAESEPAKVTTLNQIILQHKKHGINVKLDEINTEDQPLKLVRDVTLSRINVQVDNFRLSILDDFILHYEEALLDFKFSKLVFK